MNKLFHGDTLDVLRRLIRDETIDLCYIDPAFIEGKQFGIIKQL